MWVMRLTLASHRPYFPVFLYQCICMHLPCHQFGPHLSTTILDVFSWSSRVLRWALCRPVDRRCWAVPLQLTASLGLCLWWRAWPCSEVSELAVIITWLERLGRFDSEIQQVSLSVPAESHSIPLCSLLHQIVSMHSLGLIMSLHMHATSIMLHHSTSGIFHN